MPDPDHPFGAPMGQEDRRALRERWEQAGPEQRARLREEFLRQRADRLEQRRLERREGLRDRNGAGGFGSGYERRRQEENPEPMDRPRFNNPLPRVPQGVPPNLRPAMDPERWSGFGARPGGADDRSPGGRRP